MILTPSQAIVARDRHRFRVICCGRRWGKTTLAVEEMKGRAMFTNAVIAYIAPTYQQARDIAWETLKRELQGAIKSVNESRLEIKLNNTKAGESMIKLYGWESIESVRGQAFDMLVIDEVAMMRNFWTSWQEVMSPTLLDRKGEVMFISTPKGFNHFYELFNLELNKEKYPDYKSFHFTTYDNPHMSPTDIEAEKQKITETRFAQEYLADFKKVEGLVYKEFDRSRHLYDTLPANTHFEILGGVDFGYTHPAAVIHVYKNPATGDYYVENEWYQKSRTEAQIADYVQSCGFNRVYPDPENPSAIQVLALKGINVREVVKGKNSVKNGIDRVRDLFKQNKLHINKRCTNLIGELESYCYPDSQTGGDTSENPIKENDDALDAMRYVIFMEHLIRRKIIETKPRPVFEDSRYGGKLPTIALDDDITEAELARM